ncbi:hypothetical protein [Crocosphaera sp.]|uniref:hypothetical protein n=1 Tax=Crocosphaera sp. TaxID=2729996 RepID=UPI002620D655|nr:hypothetical protein [Crocosphaera sp.]MDJ0579050.1 hypothetical protein [Crocosphaera sp.]
MATYSNIFATKTKEDREKIYNLRYDDRGTDQVLRRLLSIMARQNAFELLLWIADNPGKTAKEIGKETNILGHVCRPNLKELEDVNLIYHEDVSPGFNRPWVYYLREPEVMVALRMLQNIAHLPRYDYEKQEHRMRRTQAANFKYFVKEDLGIEVKPEPKPKKKEKPKPRQRRKRKRGIKNHLTGEKMYLRK